MSAEGVETTIAFGPWAFDKFGKARGAEQFVFECESDDKPPDFFTTSGQGGDPLRMSDMNERSDILPRPRRALVQYEDRRGTPLQGTLIYPNEYDPSRKYPMVVSIYMIRSDQHFRFQRPVPDKFDDPLTHASRGYFVLLPDIVHHPDDAGPSAVDCVESAVREVLRRDIVDAARVGLMGLSMGGYETAFILCKSKLFAAGVAVSPPADWASQFLTGRSGNLATEASWLSTIGMHVPYWEDPNSYLASSVLYHAHGITAPLLIGVGGADPVVDHREGESIFRILRYLKKPAYLVVYPRGGHALPGRDFDRRVKQFFDHYIKATPPPEWLAGGSGG